MKHRVVIVTECGDKYKSDNEYGGDDFLEIMLDFLNQEKPIIYESDKIEFELTEDDD